MPDNVVEDLENFAENITATVANELSLTRLRLWDLYVDSEKDTRQDSDNWVYFTYDIFNNPYPLPEAPENGRPPLKTINSQLLLFSLFEICISTSFDFDTLQTFTLNLSKYKTKHGCYYPD